MLDSIYLSGFLALSAVVMLAGLLRQRVLFSGMALSTLSGLSALLLVSLLSGPFRLGIAFNLLSALIAAIYGIPGVIGMLALRMLTA
ncbi:MAG: hypothetical protein HFG26_06940 [Provencibacterium sp.]|jgi:hypothetical protein|nr:hypothetical protein [Provencibacterium sp.]